MNRIEEVKKILAKALFSCESQGDYKVCLPHINNIEIIADLINQLYEPQPDQYEIERGKRAKSNAIGMGLIEPDQSSRLLTEEEIIDITGCVPFGSTYSPAPDEIAFSINKVKCLLVAQRDLTASIKDAEWREYAAELIKMEKVVNIIVGTVMP